MVTMGFPKDEITESLHGQKYDDVMATYLLLGRKAPEVRADIVFTLSPAVNVLTITINLCLYISVRGERAPDQQHPGSATATDQ